MWCVYKNINRIVHVIDPSFNEWTWERFVMLRWQHSNIYIYTCMYIYIFGIQFSFTNISIKMLTYGSIKEYKIFSMYVNWHLLTRTQTWQLWINAVHFGWPCTLSRSHVIIIYTSLTMSFAHLKFNFHIELHWLDDGMWTGHQPFTEVCLAMMVLNCVN